MESNRSFPLSAVQHGMLYHHLSAPHSGVDIEQMVADLPEALDPKAFRQAWDRVVNRHGAFRSTFEWENQSEPTQSEHSECHLPWDEQDLRALSVADQQERLREFLDRDRKQGFDFRTAPLARATLFRLKDEQWTLVWTFHHILADGHCYPALIREAFAWYDALRKGDELELPAPRPYREFIEWLTKHLSDKQDRAERFWREALRGISAPTPMPGRVNAAAAANTEFTSKTLRVSEEATSLLAAFADRHDLTMNSLVLGAWALVLSAYGGGEDVVFGVTRSGRRLMPGGADDITGVCINSIPLRVQLPSDRVVRDWLKTLRANQLSMRDFEHTPLVDIQRWSEVRPGSSLFESIVVFTPRLIGNFLRDLGGEWTRRDFRFLEQTNYALTLFAYGEKELLLKLAYRRGHFSDAAMEHCLELLQSLLVALPENADQPLKSLPLVSARQRKVLLTDWNVAPAEQPQDACIHELIEKQVERTPQATAVVYRALTLSFAELNSRANQLAFRLRSLGVGPGHFVGILLKRSIDLPVAILAVLKAGAAYVPMDPSYPRQRLEWMLEDTQASVMLTQRDQMGIVSAGHAQVLCLGEDETLAACRDEIQFPASGVSPSDLAYVIFTSGSSGRPKGVMVEHRNVTSYFRAMDRHLGTEVPGAWLAVTSICFDISVQELLWTLARGYKVVIQDETERSSTVKAPPRRHAHRPMDVSLFYFAADGGASSQNRYRLLLEGSRYADRNGFAAVWTPERHFHAFGGLYPNPSTTSAAIAAITSRVQIRAGSVVLPLHNPIRVAEEWSVIDNLSQGRVGLSFATGWHANDFALMPNNYKERKDITLRGIETIRRLWRGEAVPVISGTGEEIQVRVFPPPVQNAPPMWLTSAGNVETFRLAGQMGLNVLTNLLGQKSEELAEKITAYRQAWRQHGHAGDGHVSLMLHTFVGPNLEEVRRKVRDPFLEYLKTSTDLIQKTRWEFPAFATTQNRRLQPLEDSQPTEEEMRAIMDHAFERYFQSSGLFGTPEMCLEMVDRLKGIGVNEIACLIDFGVDVESVLEGLHYLNEVRQQSNSVDDEGEYSIPAQLNRHRITHLQCTPSLASMIAAEGESLEAIRPLRKLLVGGEALPPSLALQLTSSLDGELINVYGPTEATIWSTAALIDRSDSTVSIGRPLANTRVYVLDGHQRPVPIGVPGELFIGGQGVARGYLNSLDLTQARFISDPFVTEPGSRLYRTGDLVRYREDGNLEFLGRLDQQVKIRGYRIELGEIETVLASHPAVRECVVVARERASGDKTLIAYVTANSASTLNGDGVGSWHDLWDATYASLQAEAHRPTDAALNTTGWLSSYTGKPIPEAEMREWVQVTVDRILARKPRNVLEIGCGTGMLLFRIAPHCARYHGVDFSARAIRYVEAEVQRRGLGNVTLAHGAANEITGLEPNSFDLVVINSVIQYFPGIDYLTDVLRRVASLVREGGAIFVGDVRSLPLNEAFHCSVALEQASDDVAVSEVRQRVRQRLERDSELVMDPAFFRAASQMAPTITGVSIQLKGGRCLNELTRFRYDVWLEIGSSCGAAIVDGQEAGASITLPEIRERLQAGSPVVAYRGIRNPRVVQAVETAKLLASDSCPETAHAIRRHLESNSKAGVDPAALYALDIPYEIELTWSNQALDCYDAVFRHRTKREAITADTRERADNSPIASKALASFANRPNVMPAATSLALELKDVAKARLPEYMIPATIVLLDSLPRTPNGKIDRKALPEPGLELQRKSTAFVAPETDLEKDISQVWQDLLQLERVGAHDNFFDLGANSLLVVQANSRLRTVLRRELSIVELFQYPTVNALAAHLSRSADEQGALVQSRARGRARIDALQGRRTASPAGPGPT